MYKSKLVTEDELKQYFSVAVEKYRKRTYEVESELKVTKKLLADVLEKIERQPSMKYDLRSWCVEDFGEKVVRWWERYKNKENFLEDEPTRKRSISIKVIYDERREAALRKLNDEDRKVLGLK